MSVLPIPDGARELVRLFGNIAIRDGQIVAPRQWESANMITLPALPGHNQRIYCNRQIAPQLQAAAQACVDQRYPIHSLGCFSPRLKVFRGTAPIGRTLTIQDGLSAHSWGIAFDLNAADNPRGGPLRTDIPWALIQRMREIGWIWGGEFSVPDPMHFQWVKNY